MVQRPKIKNKTHAKADEIIKNVEFNIYIHLFLTF